MKTASRILIIIQMAFCAIPFLVFIIWWAVAGVAFVQAGLNDGSITSSEGFDAAQIYGLVLVMVIVMMILCIGVIEVVGAFALRQLAKAKQPSDLTAMAIITMLFCSLIGGILMLCIPANEFQTPTAGVSHN